MSPAVEDAADRPAQEIEVTPEMVEAGVAAYSDWEERTAWSENTPALDHQVKSLIRSLLNLNVENPRQPQ